MFETNLTVNKTRKLELINLRRHGIAYMRRQSGTNILFIHFRKGQPLHF